MTKCWIGADILPWNRLPIIDTQNIRKLLYIDDNVIQKTFLRINHVMRKKGLDFQIENNFDIFKSPQVSHKGNAIQLLRLRNPWGKSE